jgi:hypothetical protein
MTVLGFRHVARGVVMAAVAVTAMVATTTGAWAGTEKVCNGAFCNATTGKGTTITQVVATKVGDNRGTMGFFEVFGPRGLKVTGHTMTNNSETFPLKGSVYKNESICVRFFAEKATHQFIEVGSAQCTKAPW